MIRTPVNCLPALTASLSHEAVTNTHKTQKKGHGAVTETPLLRLPAFILRVFRHLNFRPSLMAIRPIDESTSGMNPVVADSAVSPTQVQP